MDNMQYWNQLKQPPPSALKTIQAGRLKGMTDIKPQWRYVVLTETFGPCGVGWKFTIESLWTEQGSEEQIFAFAKILLFIKIGNEWSEPIPGIGGSMLIAKEHKGLHSSDEAFKMAVTDALSTASKMLGVAADVYMGYFDGSKYKDEKLPVNMPTEKEKKTGEATGQQQINNEQVNRIIKLIDNDETVEWLMKRHKINEKFINSLSADLNKKVMDAFSARKAVILAKTPSDKSKAKKGTQTPPDDTYGYGGPPPPREQAIVECKEMLNGVDKAGLPEMMTRLKKTPNFQGMPKEDQERIFVYYDELMALPE